MGHGDLMSRAEDVADQVSSCPRFRPRQMAEILRCLGSSGRSGFVKLSWRVEDITHHDCLQLNRSIIDPNSTLFMSTSTSVNFEAQPQTVQLVWRRQVLGVTLKSVVRRAA